MTIIRPGPPRLEPGRCPGGVVIHVYDVPSAVLLLTREVGSREECERLAAADSAWVAALTDTCCLVAYDGDTGERMKWSGA